MQPHIYTSNKKNMYKLLSLLCILFSFLLNNLQAASPQTHFSHSTISLENVHNEKFEEGKKLLAKLTHKIIQPKVSLTYQDKMVVFGTGIAGAILSGLLLVNGATFLAAAILLLGVGAALYIFWMKTGLGPKWLPRLPY